MHGSSRDALRFVGPRDVAIVAERVAAPGSGELLVETVVSAISPGTELLVYRGEAPSGVALDTSIDGMQSAARFPLKYGYATVGRVVALGPASTRAGGAVWRSACTRTRAASSRAPTSCIRCRRVWRPSTPRCTRAWRRR
jgi:NADPH:quinone reductase-like Zn-dependent oxidoreductase